MSDTILCKLTRPDGGDFLELLAERVDTRIQREPFEYKRKEVRRINDRGFMALTWVITCYYNSSTMAEKNTTYQKLVEIAKKWYSYGQGKNSFSYRGATNYFAVIKSMDIVDKAEEELNLEFVITLLEGEL